MASEVEISNLALAHLGDSATVSSIDPPEGSAQAEHCQRFYPLARDALLEMHDWRFATKRATLALLANNPAGSWAYCYAQPVDMLKAISVIDATAPDDYSAGISGSTTWLETPMPNVGVYTPQAYAAETADDGTGTILTSQSSAVLRYTYRLTDTTKFSPLFVQCLSWFLGSMLAGPVVKGEAGMATAGRLQMIAFGRDGRSGLFGQAVAADSNQKASVTRDRHSVAWIAGR